MKNINTEKRIFPKRNKNKYRILRWLEENYLKFDYKLFDQIFIDTFLTGECKIHISKEGKATILRELIPE